MILLLACVQPGDEKEGPPERAQEGVIHSTVYDAESGRDGLLTVPVEVTDDVDVFQVVVHRDDGTAGLEYLLAPDGSTVLDWQDWYDSDYSLTEAFYPAEFASTTNWPVRAEDGPLTQGTWEVVIGTYDNRNNYSGREPVTIEVLTRSDEAPETGVVRAVLAYARGVRDEDGVEAAVEEAVAHWMGIYAEIGVTLEVEYTDIDVDAALPEAYEGLEAIRAYHEGADERSVLVVIGEEIAGDEWLYGEAGGIPGPYATAEHAAVMVSWLANAGGDARFQEADVLLMGETMAHEVGHYLGLFHPVEDGYDYWDALEDTPECSGWSACEQALAENLMFPYPVCTGANAGSCVRQTGLSANQAGVVHRYVGVE